MFVNNMAYILDIYTACVYALKCNYIFVYVYTYLISNLIPCICIYIVCTQVCGITTVSL